MTDSRRRREEIGRLATTTDRPTVEDLAAQFAVPASVIRGERTPRAVDATYGIARWAAKQIRSGESLLLDAGSTVAALACQLRLTRNLTVATTSLAVLHALSEVETIHVECLGGTLGCAGRGLVGPLAEAALEHMTFDRAFLGADGITAEEGICAVDLQQTRFKELVARRADQTYVLAQAAALGVRPFHAWAPLPPGWTLVTDESAEESSLAHFRDRDADVIVVDAQGIAATEV